MMNKRDFLKSGATALAAGGGAATALAAVKPSLGPQSGLASWKAHVGQGFEVFDPERTFARYADFHSHYGTRRS